MRIGLAAVDDFDWSQLHHAYGRAVDAPSELRALLDRNPERRRAAVKYLWSAILHQGTAWTATAPAALVVAGLLEDRRLDRDGLDLRGELISFLESVAAVFENSGVSEDELKEMAAASRRLDELLQEGDDEALYQDEDASKAFYARSVLDCVRVTPALAEAVLPHLSNPDPPVRAHAAMAMVTMRRALGPARAKELVARIESMAVAARDPDERSALVLALGDLGVAPLSFLADPFPAVRVCAALAPAVSDDEGATAELLQALEKHAGEIDGWFHVRPPQFTSNPRFSVVSRVLERVHDFDRLANAATAVARITQKLCVDSDWGPLLAAAFPDGGGRVRTDAQRSYLRALVDRADLWDRKFGNPIKWFKQAGLPYDRAECAARLLSR